MLSLNIVFPVLNEERRLREGVEKTSEFLTQHFKCKYEITIVDNGSEDDTAAIAKELCGKYPFIKYVYTRKRGVGIAFKTALSENTCDIVGYMDIDLSTDIRHLLDMYKVFQKTPDVAIVNGSRWNRRSDTTGRKWYRNLTSHGLTIFMKMMFRTKASDVICGFKFFRRDVAGELEKYTSPNDGWFYIIEMLIRAERGGYNIYELPVRWKDDYDTKVNVKKTALNYISESIKLRQRFREEFVNK